MLSFLKELVFLRKKWFSCYFDFVNALLRLSSFSFFCFNIAEPIPLQSELFHVVHTYKSVKWLWCIDICKRFNLHGLTCAYSLLFGCSCCSSKIVLFIWRLPFADSVCNYSQYYSAHTFSFFLSANWACITLTKPKMISHK